MVSGQRVSKSKISQNSIQSTPSVWRDHCTRVDKWWYKTGVQRETQQNTFSKTSFINMEDSHWARFTYLNVIPFFIMHEVDCIKTPGHVILRDPLIQILSPLYWHLNNLRCSSKVTLEPLEVIVVLGWPSSDVSPPTPSVEPRQVRAMVTIPRGCCCYFLVLDTTWLHSHWSVAKNTWWRLKVKTKLLEISALTVKKGLSDFQLQDQNIKSPNLLSHVCFKVSSENLESRDL